MTKKREAKFIISAENKTAATISKITGDVSKMGGAFKKLGSLVGPALAGLATGAAVKGFASMIQRANDLTDALRDSSIRLGIGVADLQAYQLAAGNAGVSAEQLTGLLGKLNKAAGEIKLGTGSDKTIEAFDRLGISVGEIQKSNPAQLFEQVIDGLGGVSDPAARAALAMQVFGKSGQQALTLVADGSGSLKESRKLFDDLGLSLSKVDADNVARANDAIDTLSAVTEAAKQKIGAELAPTIVAVAERLLEAGRNGETMGQQIESGVAEAVETVNRLWRVTTIVGNTFSAAFNLIQAAVAGTGAAVLGFASDFVTAIGTTAPNAMNSLLAAMETGLAKLRKGFADFATAVANSVVAGMNAAIKAIDTLVNTASAGISKFIDLANKVPGVKLPTFSYSQTSAPVKGFQSFSPADEVRIDGKGNFVEIGGGKLGRFDTFGEATADVLGSYSEGFGNEASRQLEDLAQDYRDVVNGFASDDLLPPKPIEDAAAALDKATESASGFADVVGSSSGGSGGSSGGKGTATGNVKDLGKETEKTTETVVQGFQQMGEIGQAAFSGIERAIDEVTKTGKLDFAEMARSILSDIAAIIAKGAILGQILGVNQYSTSNGSGGYTAGLLESVLGSFLGPSYAGGGFTGFGSRSGGLDGRGGFPAILHPNETVVDHSAGQSLGGGTTINQTIMVRETLPSGIAAQIAKQASQQAQAALKNISDRGGNRRRSFRFA